MSDTAMVHSKPIENDTVFADIQKKEIREYLRNIQEMLKELAWGSGDIWLKRELDETVLYKTKCEVRNVTNKWITYMRIYK